MSLPFIPPAHLRAIFGQPETRQIKEALMFNDHTDAEAARREHVWEMGGDTPEEKRFYKWCAAVENRLCIGKLETLCDDEDCTSLDHASDAFDRGEDVEDYIASVEAARKERGL